MKITQAIFNNAEHAHNRAEAVLDGLSKMSEADKTGIEESIIIVQNKFLLIKAEAQKIINEAHIRHNARPEKLISMALRVHHGIPLEISRKMGEMQAKIRTFQQKKEDLIAKGFSLDEISKIIVGPSDEAIEAVDAECRALSVESAALLKFASDPFYDYSLLVGTRLECEIPQTETEEENQAA
ncbi:hypothetical protein [Methylotuvimicrobium sp. KM2]|uniref:hypothetical protein n=1 Tax=Methylotuvimicrobium sp. KM2 TaxID=3133976 RepID=UPI003100C592